MRRTLVTGSTGFFGNSVKEVLKDRYVLFAVGSKDYDLTKADQVESMFKDIKPNIVIHLASKVGGMLANKNYPAEFWYKNMTMTANVWEASKNNSIEKLIFIMPGCTYPSNASSPMVEESLWEGYPDEFPAPGALAKKMGLVASYAYKKQYGLSSCVLIPGNLYGEHDHFGHENSHVIPAIITRMHKAKKDKVKEIVLWGTGSAVRDFVYVGDAASCIPYFVENEFHYGTSPYLDNVCNIATGRGHSIKELAETIADVVGFEGELVWDVTKPEGALSKILSNKRMESVGLQCKTPLKEGVRKTYEWYLNSFAVC